MKTKISEDLEFSLSIVNCLSACYSGRFVFFKALTELGVSAVDPNEIPRTEEIIRRIKVWFDELSTGIPLFSAHWTTPGTFDAKKALDYLEALKPELRWIHGVATKALARGDIRDLELDESRILVACIARLTMTSVAYCQGNIRFGSSLGLTEFAAYNSELLPRLQAEFDGAYQMSRAFVSPDTTLGDAFVEGFTRECATISPKALTYVHDINQLTARFRGGLSFVTVEFNSQESADWMRAGFTPGDAGYWRAYNIQPTDALTWRRAGVELPSSAMIWANCGFLAKDVAEWTKLGFTPFEAQVWRDSGFSPAEARSFRERGINDPTTVPGRR